ncbi:hypothetical protein FRACYDRAFT_237348 [Fragilariopsis cylindrus CCMP1102]|uniref:Uncharacterized protein n=1 Tax=Fragilariopsis cylindrus CCMP1102 TaxID=635003 RepID=A0A1E7FLP8_9STRA|nr:hypothetical protein FRACYDRAFT_237348 [Fragilariopsis cylindrus CCMP1102]|eukprot:OEU19057.1 hypothetical protein FRACYDRAFT_237348 [Fragilariopsis cylindrus CCMP1102]
MAHLSSPQAQRTLKFITAFACTTVGIQTILFSDFDHIEGVSDGGGGNKFVGKPHIFTNIQKEFQNFVDINIYGINSANVNIVNTAVADATANANAAASKNGIASKKDAISK